MRIACLFFAMLLAGCAVNIGHFNTCDIAPRVTGSRSLDVGGSGTNDVSYNTEGGGTLDATVPASLAAPATKPK